MSPRQLHGWRKCQNQENGNGLNLYDNCNHYTVGKVLLLLGQLVIIETCLDIFQKKCFQTDLVISLDLPLI